MAKHREMIPEGMVRPKHVANSGWGAGGYGIEASLRQSPRVNKKGRTSLSTEGTEVWGSATDGGLFIDLGSADLHEAEAQESSVSFRQRMWESLPENVRLRAEQYRK